MSLNHTIKHRLASEHGFSSLELRIVIALAVVLVAIALPAFVSFGGKASTAAAQTRIRTAIPAAETYFNDTDPTTGGNGSYGGITGARLRGEVPGIAVGVKAGDNGQKYCLEYTDGGSTFSYEGGLGGATAMTAAPCAAEYEVSA